MDNKVVIFWFRRDLRLEDNKGLQQALASGLPVLPVFIFDTEILDQLSNPYDRRVDYIHQALTAINQVLPPHDSALQVYHGKPLDIFKKLTEQYKIQAVYCNRDYEPQAIKRDQVVKTQLQKYDIDFYDFKDQVIFEQSEIVKADGLPYTVYTPYAKKWRSQLLTEHYKATKTSFTNFLKVQPHEIISLADIGFRKTDINFQKPTPDFNIIKDYNKYRDFPSLDKTSHLGIALRFGTISIRECVAFAVKHNDIWLSELIWREFFMQILYHFPEVVHRSFKPQYDYIEWRNNEEEFQRWCNGETGYPIVDAGMKQLNTTGFMHNRVRMIVASFLCKHLLIDWRWGETYFAEKLLDYDLAANNGNWQWAAGCGCDAAPYFRIFNPTAQTQKFDKDLLYIKKWNPAFQQNIAPPIVQHEMARQRALAVYKKALQNSGQ
ncbi:deoxyribodipyrimidine photolyase [Elizabethkingia miricola]|uniref:Deoxyribodipyrimidine photolyase n=1 Tax=Elizabethkingia miricola TaxID=172045 RepID=A0ABD4DP65_ELIMR|nr:MULTISPECIES: deoxyribodipyrimidine photo-lyase [Elizabethkingia]KUY20562.1 deoxyribodipyrimidine photolyase [Elizabethkingia miricola]MCL1653251.1 DNA photolyase family protein [Elizabethkingia miricola]OPC70385.1 deoxyribodipyrimidine photolyase [Elizabethkingia miricola]OPC74314.1 deoxyribodipyrimidine photolyase [Elizabethkingia miricola]QCO45197.1 deoxyribodipyrimidine photo-lyase [Elizabethkingia sp. 2-6]